MTTHADDVTLLPCPFCGSAPALNSWTDYWPDRVQICCENEDCQIEGVHTPVDDGWTCDKAIAAWNTRAALRPPAPAVAQEAIDVVIAARETLQKWTASNMLSGDPKDQSAASFRRDRYACYQDLCRLSNAMMWLAEDVLPRATPPTAQPAASAQGRETEP